MMAVDARDYSHVSTGCAILWGNRIDENGASVGSTHAASNHRTKRTRRMADYSVYHTPVSLQPHTGEYEQFLLESVWVFPKHYTDYHGSGACVYFVTCDCYPELIKIGYTNTSLSSRRTHIEGLHKSSATVQAFAKHHLPRKFEQALHRYFATYRQGGYEWFERDPVDAWLRQFRSAS